MPHDDDTAFFAGLHDDSYGFFPGLDALLYPNQGANLPGGGANLPGWATGGGSSLPDSYPRRDGTGTMTRPAGMGDDTWRALLEGEGYSAGGGGIQPSGANVMDGIEQGVGIFSELFNTFAPAIMANELAKQGASQDRIAELHARLAENPTASETAAIEAQYASEIEALRQANAALASQKSGFWNPITITLGGLLGLGLFGTLITVAVRGMGNRNASPFLSGSSDYVQF